MCFVLFFARSRKEDGNRRGGAKPGTQSAPPGRIDPSSHVATTGSFLLRVGDLVTRAGYSPAEGVGGKQGSKEARKQGAEGEKQRERERERKTDRKGERKEEGRKEEAKGTKIGKIHGSATAAGAFLT